MSYSNRGFNLYLPSEGWCNPKDDMHFRRSVEWVPLRNAVGRSFATTYGVIYPRVIGMLPYYAGHVPGEVYSVGHTFGRSTIDAKRWLALNHD